MPAPSQEELLRSTLSAVAPGSGLRDGLERILRGRTGALIVLGMDEAVERANATRYGLGNTVYARRRSIEIARKLRSGMVSINSVIAFAGIPSLPFGGVGDSGFGRIHGADGLREFARPKAIARRLFRVPLDITTFSKTERSDRLVAALTRALYGRK